MTVALSPIPEDTASNTGLLNALLSEDTRRVIRSTPYVAPQGNDFIDAAGAALGRENTLLSAWHYITDGDSRRSLEAVSGYNPYAALKANFDPDTLSQLSASISNGEFDQVRSDAQLNAVVKDVLDDRHAQESMNKSGLGYMAGSLIASVLDPVSYIPFVDAAKFGKLGKIGLGALNAALSAGTSETVLQLTQTHRSLEESLMNIGTAGVIGGGIGVFAAALHPQSALHPTNVNNPLKRENLRANGEISRDMTGATDELSADEINALQRDYVSAGAASARDAFPTIARNDPKTFVGKAARAVGDFVNSATIKGQVLRAASGPARWLGVRLFDPAGILFEDNLKGVANARSATILKQGYMQDYEQLIAGLEAKTRQLSADIGQKVPFADALLLTQRHLYSMMDEKTANALGAKFGDKFDAVDKAAREFADRIHEHNAVWEKRLTDAGMLANPKEVVRLKSELDAKRSEIETQLEADKADAENASPATIKAMRAERDDLAKKLAAEKAKGMPLGRDYGHAQMWNRDSIFQSPSEFKGWLHDVFAFTPDESWLIENHGLTSEDFAKLSPEEARPIREDWAGDAYSHRVEQIQHRLDGLKQTMKEQRLDIEEALRWFGAIDKRETNLTLSEARKKRDQVWSKMAANKDPEAKARAEKLDALFRKIEETHEDLKVSKDELEAGIKDAKSAHAETTKDAAKAGRALKSARKQTPLNEMIEQVYENLADRGSLPHGIIERLMEESDRTTGRVKQRVLHLDKDQRIHAIQKGWLRDDLSNILYSQNDQLASELSLREAIGIGSHFENWQDAVKWVQRSYQDMIEEAKDQKVKNHLQAEMGKTVANLQEARDRLRGGNFVDDGTATGWMAWAANKMKRANLIRYGSGFLLSSLTDTATFALRHGSLSGALSRYGMKAVKIMRQAADEDPTHFRAMISSIEIGMGAHATAKRFGSEDAMHGMIYGYGIGTGTARKVTGKIDQITEHMSEIGVKIGGLPLWNTFWKTVAGLSMLDRLRTMTARYHELDAGEIADLATLGIGRGEAERIASFMGTHGEEDGAGGFDPHFENWTGPGGAEASRDAQLAIMRDMNRAINTPDVGDTPRLMTTIHGSLLLTFQTFAFTFMNQFAYPLVQRLSLFKDKQAMMSSAILLASAAAVMVGKDILAGRNPEDRFSADKWQQTLYELVDRTGMLGFTSPYADSFLKFTSPITHFAGGDRYVRNGYLESLLGINFSLVKDTEKATAGLLDNSDPDRIKKLMTIAPFAAQVKLLGHLLDLNN